MTNRDIRKKLNPRMLRRLFNRNADLVGFYRKNPKLMALLKVSGFANLIPLPE